MERTAVRLIAALGIILVGSTSAKNLPSYIKPCPQSHPDLTSCLKDLFESIRPQLAKGIPEMRIPPLDPFYIPALSLDQGSGSVNFKATFRDIKSYGAKNFVLKDIKIDFDKPTIKVDVFFPSLKINTDYEINGKVLVVPIKGHGKSVGNFTNVAASVTLLGKYVTKNNKQYIDLQKNKVSIKIGGLRVYFANLFNGNKQLSDSTNMFINENWRDILQEITPLVEETVDTLMVGIIRNIFDLYSVDELFPQS